MSEPSSWITIASERLSAQIDPQGAQLSRLTSSSREELLWDGNPAVWAGRAPLLFPIVGVLAGGSYRLDSKTYRLPRHGFARNRAFSVVSHSDSTVRLRLSADAATLQVYPFDFSLEVEFGVVGPTLTITSSIRQRGEGTLYASFGYHPALCWPLPFGQPRSAHFIEFDYAEAAPVRRINSDGLLKPEAVPTPVIENRLVLADALFEDDVLIFDRLKSRSLSYGAAEGPHLRVDFSDAPYLGIWSKPGANFLCIEPWHGITDPEGYAGDYTDKPGVFAVRRDADFSTRMVLALNE